MSATELQTIFETTKPTGYTVDYTRFSLVNVGHNKYALLLRRHTNVLTEITLDSFDSPLELVELLNEYLATYLHKQQRSDDSALIEWAGRIVTDDPELESQDPDKYCHVPEIPDKSVR